MKKIIALSQAPLASFSLAIQRTQSRYENASSSSVRARLRQRIYDLKHIETFFKDSSRSVTFLGFEGWGKQCHGVDHALDRIQNVSEFDGFHWKDETGVRHYHKLGSSIAQFDGRVDVSYKPLADNDHIATPLLMPRSYNMSYRENRKVLHHIHRPYGEHSRARIVPVKPMSMEAMRRVPSLSIDSVDSVGSLSPRPSASPRALSLGSLLDLYKMKAREYKTTPFSPINEGPLSLSLNREKQYFKLKGVTEAQKVHLLSHLKYTLAVDDAYENVEKWLKHDRIHLSYSALVALKTDTARPKELEWIAPLLNAVSSDSIVVTVEKAISRQSEAYPKLQTFRHFKYDLKSRQFSYKVDEREGRYFIAASDLQSLFSSSSSLSPTIKGKASIGKSLLWKWGLFIPQVVYGASAEFAHSIVTHGGSSESTGFFVDGADDTDMVLATNRKSVEVLKGISTFLIMPMAIDLLNDGQKNQANDVQESRENRQTLAELHHFLQYYHSVNVENSVDIMALKDRVRGIVEALEDDELSTLYMYHNLHNETSVVEIEVFLSKMTAHIQEKLTESDADVQLNTWKYKAIWCMATGLKLHFAVSAPLSIAAASGLGTASTSAQGFAAFSSANVLGKGLLIGDSIANPIAFAGQLICSYCAVNEALQMGEDAYQTGEIINELNTLKTALNEDLSGVDPDVVEDCMAYLKRAQASLIKNKRVTALLAMGQGLMAVGTLLSTAITVGATTPLAVTSALKLVQLISSSIGLGGTLAGAGGGGFFGYQHECRFGSEVLPEDREGVYTAYHEQMRDALQHGAVSREEALGYFLNAKETYMNEHPEIYENYIKFQSVYAQLSGAMRAQEKYTDSKKYVGLQSSLTHVDSVNLPSDKMAQASLLYELFFNREIPENSVTEAMVEPDSETTGLLASSMDASDWGSLVHELLTNSEYQTRFHETLVESLLYSHLPQKNELFSTAVVSKHSKGWLAPFSKSHGLKKDKTLRCLNVDILLNRLEKEPDRLCPLIHKAVLDLISDVKTHYKKRIRGINYDLPAQFIQVSLSESAGETMTPFLSGI